MAWCRFADDSDVYIYEGGDDSYTTFVCCGCFLHDHWECETEDEMIDHVWDHVAAGHMIRPHLMTELWLLAWKEDAHAVR